MACNHPSGDTVNGYWLCATCYAKLAERPKHYQMVERKWMSDAPPRQEVMPAPVAVAQSMTLGRFVKAMALRLVAKTAGSMSMADATDYAVDILRALAEPFGSPDMDWSTAGAWELVADDMQYWDGEAAAGNA